jgi:hypothetical protein
MFGMADTLAADLSKVHLFVISIIFHQGPGVDRVQDGLAGLSMVLMQELWALSDSIVRL